MGEAAKHSKQINGLAMEDSNQETVRLLDLKEEDPSSSSATTATTPVNRNQNEETLYGIFNRIVSAVFSPDPNTTLFQRIKGSVYENVPLLQEASRNSARNLLVWTRQGSSLRALLVISVGTIVLVALTGLLVFMLFFVVATVNAIIISLLMSLAAAGGFLALFFACTTAIYIGALSVAVFVISCTTITTIFAVMVATGWVGFFWVVWIATRKGMGLAKHSLNMTGSALSAYTASRHVSHTQPTTAKDSD